MSAFRVWSLFWMLGFVDVSWCVSEFEYDNNYDDNYANEILLNHPEGDFQSTPCQNAWWDKVFIALEDSHMRQNMLLGSLEQCSGDIASLKTRVDMLAEGMSEQSVSSPVCKQQEQQASLKLQQGLAELREEGAERERRLNSTLRRLLHAGPELNLQSNVKEEGSGATASGRKTQETADMGKANRSAQRHGPFPAGVKEPEAGSSADMASIERALIAIETDLQEVKVQLNRVLERVG